ncbi:MAG: hypothetical protein ACE361_26920 [Aureliella sp.]
MMPIFACLQFRYLSVLRPRQLAKTIVWFAACVFVGPTVVAQEDVAVSSEWTLSWTPILAKGVAVPGGIVAELLPPTLVSELRTAEAALTDLAGPVGLERFTRNNLNAPVRIKIDDLQTPDEDRCGYSIHSAYVLYAEISKLKDRDFMESVFGAGEGKKSDGAQPKELTEDELEVLGVRQHPNLKLVRIELPLLRKVVIRGLIEVERVEAPNAFLLVWRLVSPARLQELGGNLEAAEAVGTWAPLSTNDLGEQVEGEAQPYHGLGGYVCMMATGLEEEQLLVETRMIMHEHRDWFSGSRYLRSKLPLSLQSSAKELRRKLR